MFLISLVKISIIEGFKLPSLNLSDNVNTNTEEIDINNTFLGESLISDLSDILAFFEINGKVWF